MGTTKYIRMNEKFVLREDVKVLGRNPQYSSFLTHID
jgi:hypothetical protein